MIPIKKNLILTVLVGVLILLVTPASVFPRVLFNGAGGGYDEADGTDFLKKTGLRTAGAIEANVISGAGCYLDAYSHILLFLNRVELSDLKGMDYNESRQLLDRALDNMINALKTYERLIKKADATPYNERFISRLLDLDYSGFMQERGLNSVIFGKVEDYLSRGDITGMCRQMYTEFTIIAGMLNSVRDELFVEKLPDMSKLWRLNERCSQTMLFGQYASRVFYEVLYNTL